MAQSGVLRNRCVATPRGALRHLLSAQAKIRGKFLAFCGSLDLLPGGESRGGSAQAPLQQSRGNTVLGRGTTGILVSTLGQDHASITQSLMPDRLQTRKGDHDATKPRTRVRLPKRPDGVPKLVLKNLSSIVADQAQMVKDQEKKAADVQLRARKVVERSRAVRRQADASEHSALSMLKGLAR